MDERIGEGFEIYIDHAFKGWALGAGEFCGSEPSRAYAEASQRGPSAQHALGTFSGLFSVNHCGDFVIECRCVTCCNMCSDRTCRR